VEQVSLCEIAATDRLQLFRHAWQLVRHRLGISGVLVAVAALISLPAAFGPVRLNDSFWIDWVWLQQFAGELGKGVGYPRWLPLSHGGLGSPVFYFYPPLAFYAASAFTFLGIGTYGALVATFAAASLLSGLGVYLWLKGQSDKALVGALLFMIAPYQLFDFYQRGAIAEFVASAFMPFVLLGIRRMLGRQPNAFVLTALSYAALTMSHLPLTLLASLFLFGPYALIHARASPAMLLRVGAALATGLALAAVYVIPALALESYRSSEDLWLLPYLQPASWSLWRTEAWRLKEYRAVLVMISAIAIPLVALLVRHRSAWGLWSLTCLILAAGAVPLLWLLPGLQSVQFPYRLLPVAELAFVTAVALAPRERISQPTLWLPLLAIAAFVISAKPERMNLSLHELQTLHPDVPENLPPGRRPYSWPSRWALDVAAAHPTARFDGRVTLEPVFYFPTWEVRCRGLLIRTFPDPKTQLLAHEGHGCSRSLGWTPSERVGTALSLLALLFLIGLLTHSAARVRRQLTTF
jgi:hypothetical protein